MQIFRQKNVTKNNIYLQNRKKCSTFAADIPDICQNQQIIRIDPNTLF